MPVTDAIILATFGSADDNVRKIFDALVDEISAEFPTFEVRTAMQLGICNV